MPVSLQIKEIFLLTCIYIVINILELSKRKYEIRRNNGNYKEYLFEF